MHCCTHLYKGHSCPCNCWCASRSVSTTSFQRDVHDHRQGGRTSARPHHPLHQHCGWQQQSHVLYSKGAFLAGAHTSPTSIGFAGQSTASKTHHWQLPPGTSRSNVNNNLMLYTNVHAQKVTCICSMHGISIPPKATHIVRNSAQTSKPLYCIT